MGEYCVISKPVAASRTGWLRRRSAARVACGVTAMIMAFGLPANARAAGTAVSGGNWYTLNWFNANPCTPGTANSGAYVGACTGSSGTSNAHATVTAGSGSAVDAVMGGLSGQGSVANSTVTMTGGTANSLSGGYAIDGSATGNTATMSGGNLTSQGDVEGGYSTYGDVTDNTVTISGGTTNRTSITGGFRSGASNGPGTVDGNSATISGGSMSAHWVAGGYNNGNGTANNNTVTISGGLIDTPLMVGGYVDGTGMANDNTVTISGGMIDTPFMVGGYGDGGGTANGNTVTISKGSINTPLITGGYGDGGGTVNGNTVTISGGTVAGAGGSPVLVVAGIGDGAVTNNRIILSGSPTMADAVLYGGMSSSNAAPTGSVLEVRTTGLVARNVYDFQELDFLLPATMSAGTTVLTLTAGPNTDLRGVKVGVALQAGAGQVLKQGDRVTLVHNANGVQTDPTISQASMTGYQGIALGYTFDLSADTDDLFATVESAPKVVDQTKAPVEARASMMTLLQRGVDLADSAGMANAQALTSATQPGAFFGAITGGHARYDTGSHTNVDGMGVVLGLARRFAQASGELLTGAYVQGGVGSYNTYNDFDGGQTVHGNGSSHDGGLGALLRKDWARKDGGGPYVTGGVEIGRVHSKWASDEMQGSPHVSYDTSSNYYGARAGGGYVKPLARHTNIDFSAQYYYTHMTGDEATLAGNEFDFKAVNSSRARLGARLNHTFGNQVVGYVGAIFERQFDGQARATVLDMATPSPTLEGNTGILELGFHTKPTVTSPLTIDFAVQAYTGVREGVSGTVNLNWLF